MTALSARNPKVQRLRRLAHRRRDREEQRAFVLEGPHLVADALHHGHRLEAVFVEGEPVLDVRLDGVDVPVFELEPGTLAKVTDTVSPQGVVAVAPLPQTTLDDVLAVLDAGRSVVVLAGLGDPGNAGTMVRIAEAAGMGAVLFTDDSVDPFAPKCVRASAGSLLHVPVVSGIRSVQALESMQGRARRLGTAASSGPSFDVADLDEPVALVLGSEAHGVPADLEPLLDAWVHVPMEGQVESLNVAVTGAVVCFELARRRRAVGPTS